MHQQFMRAALLATVVMGAASLTGCASIVSGTSQVVSVETLHSSGNVAGAMCKLENDKCDKPGFDAGLGTFKSSTKGMMAGNIVFGGVIGAGVDAASGAAYDYPTLFQVVMGQQAAAPTGPSVAAATPAVATSSAP
jgi:hypothetical protein